VPVLVPVPMWGVVLLSVHTLYTETLTLTPTLTLTLTLPTAVIFEDFGFAQCLRRPAAWFSAYEFSATRGAGCSMAPAAAAAGAGASSSSIGGNGSNTSSCTIIDSGFSFSHVLPFVNGKCIKKSVKRVNIGGKLLTNYLKELVSYRQWNMMEEFPLVDQVKEQLCYVAGDFQRVCMYVCVCCMYACMYVSCYLHFWCKCYVMCARWWVISDV